MKSGPTLDARTRRAEREGFEPSIRVSTYAGLANRCLQPLGHLSRRTSKLRRLRERREASVLRLKLPQHVHNHPAAAPLRQLQIVDPIGSIDSCRRGVLVDVQNAD